MKTNQDVATSESAAVEKKTRERETVLVPAVDIFEDAHQITVQAEMPGVSKDKLNVQADRNGLLIEEGTWRSTCRQGWQPCMRTYRPPGIDEALS
jgi:HSP20 family molecular chaperone IbpA